MNHLTKLITSCYFRNRFIDNLCFHCKSPIHDYVKLQQYMSIIWQNQDVSGVNAEAAKGGQKI